MLRYAQDLEDKADERNSAQKGDATTAAAELVGASHKPPTT